MSECKLSIVISMYNIEDYIMHCLECCTAQSNVSSEEYEIIVVNDGSTDKGPEKVSKFIEHKQNVRMITQVNGGLSSARNTGVDNAQGEFIWFVDGDDAIAPSSIRTVINYICKTNCDALICNFSTFETKELLSTSHFEGYSKALSGREIHNQYQRIMPMMAWLTIYKTSLLREHHLYFRVGIVHEDMEFSIRAHHCATKIVFVPESLYYYRVARADSIMNASRKDNTKSLVSQIEIIKSFKDFFKGEDNSFTRKVIGMCATSFFIRKYDDAFVKNETTTRLLSQYKSSLYQDMWRSGQWKRRLLLLFIFLMPSIVVSKVLKRVGDRSKLM